MALCEHFFLYWIRPSPPVTELMHGRGAGVDLGLVETHEE